MARFGGTRETGRDGSGSRGPRRSGPGWARPAGAWRAVALLLVGALVAAGCGLDGASLGLGDDETTTTAPTTTATASTDTVATTPVESCPMTSEALAAVNAATYAVYGETFVNDPEEGPTVRQAQIGTAWAVDDHVLVTNGHITEAYREFAADGVQLDRAFAIEAGTGTLVDLTEAITHPGYTGDPLGSPDVGLLITEQTLPTLLPLAPDDVELQLGELIHIVGFPGDVTDTIQIIPGETVPQATSLSGAVTALRTFGDAAVVTPANIDIIQHQAPTTPGTSGSSMVACGAVVGVNNAGTVNLVAVPTEDGSLTIDRQAAAANNFAIHVRHIRELVGLYLVEQVTAVSLPVEAETEAMDVPLGMSAGVTLTGEVTDPYPHTIEITVADDGSITGQSTWGGNVYGLYGVLFSDGSVVFTDDGPEVNPETSRGVYQGTIVDDQTISGEYYEERDPNVVAEFTATVTG
ncbi:MAG: trypsin-like serine peptidase [Acidimicrobiales bacterium]